MKEIVPKRDLIEVTCENIRFSSLFVAKDVSREGNETSSATKSEEKRMFSQAMIEADQVLVQNWPLQVVNKLKTMMKDVRISRRFFPTFA